MPCCTSFFRSWGSENLLETGLQQLAKSIACLAKAALVRSAAVRLGCVLQIIDALIAEVGKDKVGVRLSPFGGASQVCSATD